MPDTLRVLALPGSLRQSSLNRRLLLEAQRLAPNTMEIELFDLHALPLFDQDVEEQGDPAPVVALKEAIRDCDAVLIGCPEYNLSITGVLGTPAPSNDCSGIYAIDMNLFAVSAGPPVPLAALQVPGTVVNCQFWGRDPGFPAPFNTTLTDGLEYPVGL
jgi:hypothetical protein